MLVGRNLELNELNSAYEQMLAGKGSVVFLTGEAGLGKTTLVQEWWSHAQSAPSPVPSHVLMGRDRRGLGRGDKGAADLSTQPLPNPLLSRSTATGEGAHPDSSTLFLEAACSIPIANIDIGRLEALQPWADIISGISEFGLGNSEEMPDASQSQSSPQSGIRNPKSDRSVDLKQLAKDSASSWALAVPLVGGLAHAAIETTRLVQEQRAFGAKLNLKQLIHDAAPAWAWALPVVGDVLHAAAETARLAHEQRHPGEQESNGTNQQQVFQQYVNLLTKISEEMPLVIFLDDLHWADTSSCNLLFYLSRQIPTARILVIGTYRADDAMVSHEGKGHPILSVKNEILRYEAGRELVLGYLDAAAIRNIIAAKHPAAHPPSPDLQFEQWLLKISGGNSLFITQYLKTLQEDNLLDEHGRFVGEYERVKIPETALAVVEERARRLDDDTRELLMYATAEGEEFTSYLLARITERKPLDLLRDLQRGIKHSVIVERGKGRVYANQMTSIYGFSHSLFHKALYDHLIEEQKEFLHRQCYELLKSEWDVSAGGEGRGTTLATKLITHAEKCAEWECVADVALTEARTAWSAFSAEESLAMTGRVLVAATHLPHELAAKHAEALRLRGLIVRRLGRNMDSLADFSAARQMFAELTMAERAVDTLNDIASTYYAMSDYDRSLETATGAEQEAVRCGYREGEATALSHRAQASFGKGSFDEAMAFHERSLAISTEIGYANGVATTVGNIGLVYRSTGDYRSALEYHRRGLALHDELGNLSGAADASMNIGNVLLRLGDIADSFPYFDRALKTYESIGHRDGVARAWSQIAMAYREEGSSEAAIENYSRAVGMMEAVGNKRGHCVALLNLGNTYFDLAKPTEAMVYQRRALEASIENGDELMQAWCLSAIGAVERESNNLDEAERCLTRANALAVKMKLGELIPSTLLELAQLAERRDDPNSALQLFREARALFETSGNPLEIQRCDTGIARLTNKIQLS